MRKRKSAYLPERRLDRKTDGELVGLKEGMLESVPSLWQGGGHENKATRQTGKKDICKVRRPSVKQNGLLVLGLC
jgi:hypothetical protein